MIRRLLIDRMLEENMTIIVSTHNLNEINEICDSAALLHYDRQQSVYHPVVFPCPPFSKAA